MRHIRYVFGSTLFFLVHLVCIPAFGQEMPPAPGVCDTAVVATVGPVQISAKEFRESYEWGPSFVKKAADPKRAHLQYLINEKLIALDGYSCGRDTAGSSKNMLKEIEDDAAVTEWYRQTILPRVAVDSEQVRRGTEQAFLGVTFRYIYADNEFDMKDVKDLLDHGTSFDSLYASLYGDTKYLAEESSTNFFELSEGTAAIAESISRMKPGSCSGIIPAKNGFYVVRLDDAKKDRIVSQTQYAAIREKVETFYRRKMLDSITVSYVRKVLERCPPTISGGALKKIFSFFSRDMESVLRGDPSGKGTLRPLELKGRESVGNESLVTSKCETMSVQDFFDWYSYRNENIDLSKPTAGTAHRLKNLIFKMVRDKRLIAIARTGGYAATTEVQAEMKQWKDKLAYWRQKSAAVPQTVFTDEDGRNFFAKNKRRYSKDTTAGQAIYDSIRGKVMNDLTLFEYNNLQSVPHIFSIR